MLIINNFPIITYLESIVNCANPRVILRELFRWKYVDLSRSSYQQTFILKEQHFAGLGEALYRLAVHKARKFSPWHLSCSRSNDSSGDQAYDVMTQQIFILQASVLFPLSTADPKLSFKWSFFSECTLFKFNLNAFYLKNSKKTSVQPSRQ